MLASVVTPNAPETTMPAPENLTTQTPGTSITDQSGSDNTQTNAAPIYLPKHHGGGRWKVVDTNGEWFSDFVGANKEEAQAEADRLIAGGEPFVGQNDAKATKPVTTAKPAVAKQATKPAAGGTIDPSTLKQAVMTPDGWLCPEPKKGA